MVVCAAFKGCIQLAIAAFRSDSIFLGYARNDRIEGVSGFKISSTYMREISRVESPLLLNIVGGFRRALSEWRAQSYALIAHCFSARVAQPPTMFGNSGNRALFAATHRVRLSLLTFFGSATRVSRSIASRSSNRKPMQWFLTKKVSGRRATPGNQC